MVKIRLRRVGAKKQPSYRVVVADSRSPRDGRFIEVIGFYNPRTEPETVTIKEDRALYWLSTGAQPTAAVARLLKNQGTLARFERLRQGEPTEALLAEAEVESQAAPAVSPKTRREPAAPVAEEPSVEPEPEPSEIEDEAEKEKTAELTEAEGGGEGEETGAAEAEDEGEKGELEETQEE
jgi:small subunit ribosomal protein S16